MSQVSNIHPFPDHNIDPKKKDREWILKFAKACWNDFSTRVPQAMFFHAASKYSVVRQYAMGQQSVNKYKPMLRVDEANNDAWMNIDWSVLPILPKFRRSILSKLNKVDYNIWCQAVDQLARDETGEYFSKVIAKIMLREAIMQTDPSLMEVAPVAPEPGEPQDLEELAIQASGNWKHQMAIEAEQGIKLVFEQNDMRELRKLVRKDMVDLGVGGYKEYIENGAVKIRKIFPKNFFTSYCRRPDFKDALYMGEVTEITFGELKQAAGNQFTAQEYEEIAKKCMGKWQNPRAVPSDSIGFQNNYDNLRVRVIDLEFYSVNDLYYEERKNKHGNTVLGRAEYKTKGHGAKQVHKVAAQVIYQAKWILDTNYMYDYGLQTDMKRAKSSMTDTSFSYHVYAADFEEMQATSLMEQCIPIADRIQIAWYKLQNVINQARPKGIMIEIGALEDIPLGKNGKKFTPLEVLDMYDKRGDLVYRKIDAQGRQSNYRPIEELENGLGKDAIVFYDIIQRDIQMLRDILGFNEMTDGSTPDSRTLTTVAQMAYEGTNNALGVIVEADRYLLEDLAKSVVLRLQDVVAHGKAEGYVRSLGDNTIRFITLSPKLALHEFGIMLRDKPTDEQKQRMLLRLEEYKRAGLLEPEDEFMIENTDNIKVAEQLISYRVKKRKQEMQQKAMADQQANASVQMQSNQAAEEAKRQTMQMENDMKIQYEKAVRDMEYLKEEMKKMWDYKIAELKLGGETAGEAEAAEVDERTDDLGIDPALFEGMEGILEGRNEDVYAEEEAPRSGPVPFT